MKDGPKSPRASRDLLYPALAFPAGVMASPLEDPGWFVFMLPAVIAFTVIALLVAILVRLRRAPRKKSTASASIPLRATLINLETKRSFPIDTVPWRIGRSRSNSLPVEDHSVSRVHAEIFVNDAGEYHLSDLESLNGVYLNEKRVDIAPLNHDDIVDIGDVRFRFEFQSGPDENH